MSYKPTLLIEPNIFYEDEVQDTKSIIAKYFDVEEVDSFSLQVPFLVGKEFRTSLNMARRMLITTKPYDCTSWVPILREFMISPSTIMFNELGYFKEYFNGSDFPAFIRPNNGHKTFSGQVFYGIEQFEKECKWLKQQNVGDELLCMYNTSHKVLEREYRCVFIDHKFVDMSRYMSYGEKDIVYEYDKDVQKFAEVIMDKLIASGFVLNIPNIVIDIAIKEEDISLKYPRLNLIEINMFETASFYACDLDKVYSTWQQQIFKSL